MAYKFQLGAAVLSGSLTQEGEVLAKDSALSGSSLSLNGVAVNATAAEINAIADASARTAAAVDVSADHFIFADGGATGEAKVESLADLATAQAGNGISATNGVFAIARDAGGGGENSFALGSDGLSLSSSVAHDGLNLETGQLKVQVSGAVNLAGTAGARKVGLSGSLAGNGLDYEGGVASISALKVSVDDSSIEINSDSLRVKDGGIDNDMLAGSIANTKLANDGMTIGTTDVSLGDSITAIVGLTDLDLAAGDRTIFDTVGANTLTIGASGTTVTIPGNLTVTGTTVEIDSAFVVTSSIQFEGAVNANDNEITLTTAEPTADRTITLPDLTGHVPLLAGAISNENVTAAEFALLDGGSTVQTATVADGDAVLFNDSGSMKHINVTSLKTYFQSGVTADTAQGFAYNQYGTGSAAQDMNGATGFWGVSSDDGTSSNSVTLDLSGSWSNGNVVIIKGYSNIDTDSRPMTIRAAGDNTVEGEETISLESDNAAVTLVYAGGNWSIV